MSSNIKKEQCNTFHTMGLEPPLLKALEKLGFKTPTSIQEETIPLILSGKNIVGHAQTGTGKTAAFGLPAIQSLFTKTHDAVLVMTPTRELASQVREEMLQLGSFYKLKVAMICGGKSFKDQIDAIKKGVKIVIATPGRLLDLLSRKKIKKFSPTMVIVDEADEMLNMGFLEDIKAIFKAIDNIKQTLLFSATIPQPISTLIKKFLKDPHFVKAKQQQITSSDILQSYCLIKGSERDDAIIRLLENQKCTKALIFCRTKKEVDRLSNVLYHQSFSAKGLHGDMKQSQRDQVITSFRSGKIKILVATDVAARGINILDISHVINYHMPFDAENYVHRIGRTGRAGKKGNAVSLTTPMELNKLLRFSKFAGGSVKREMLLTKKEIKKQQIDKLVSTIVEQNHNEDIHVIARELNSTMDWKSITFKLLTMFFKKNIIKGPERIGIQGDVNIRENQNNRRRKNQKNSNYRFFSKKGRYQGRKKFNNSSKKWKK